MPVNCHTLAARLLVVVVVAAELETRKNQSLGSFDRPRVAYSSVVVPGTVVVVETHLTPFSARADQIRMRHRD